MENHFVTKNVRHQYMATRHIYAALKISGVRYTRGRSLNAGCYGIKTLLDPY